MAATVRPPGQPPILEGFLNLRGKAIPVVRLRRLFDLSSSEPEIHTPVIVVRFEHTILGLLVDRAEQISAYPASFQPLEENHSLNDCAQAQFEVEGRSVVLLDCGRFLFLEERKRMTELQSEAQCRLDEIEAARA